MTTNAAIARVMHFLIESEERPLLPDEQADLKVCLEIVEHDLVEMDSFPQQEATE